MNAEDTNDINGMSEEELLASLRSCCGFTNPEQEVRQQVSDASEEIKRAGMIWDLFMARGGTIEKLME